MAQPLDTSHVIEQRASEPSLGELFAELSRETSELVREEVQLAKTEISQTASEVGKDVGFLVAGAAVVYAGFLAIVAAVIILVAHALPWWLAALIVGIVVAAIGGFLVMRGIEELKQTRLVPQATVETLKEDTTWAKNQMTS